MEAVFVALTALAVVIVVNSGIMGATVDAVTSLTTSVANAALDTQPLVSDHIPPDAYVRLVAEPERLVPTLTESERTDIIEVLTD